MNYSTFYRLNGLAVVLVSHSELVAVVRYIGLKGKAITEQPFTCPVSDLKEF